MELLPSYNEIKTRFHLNEPQKVFIEQTRQVVRNILDGVDPRLLLIMGPCSIHDIKSAKEYALRLKQLAEDVSDHFFILMRVFCEKPRTSTGWKGFLYDPFLDGSNAIKSGIEFSRQLFLDLADLKVPAATEFLDPLTAFYYEDLVSWGSIGARTSSSQTHRQLASGLNIPIGIKNGIAGNVSAAIHGVVSCLHSHSYMGLNEHGQPCVIHTKGNPDGHIVLRGGDSGPNYEVSSIIETLKHLQEAKLHSRLIIDCSHQNSQKKPINQVNVFKNTLEQFTSGNTAVRGMMLESHLFGGCQNLGEDPRNLKYGVSITDACLDWSSTEKLISQGNAYLKQNLTTINEKKSNNCHVPSLVKT